MENSRTSNAHRRSCISQPHMFCISIQKRINDENKVKSALIENIAPLKDQNDTLANRILAILEENPLMTQGDIAEKVGVSVPSVKRAMKKLSEAGRIIRKGGKRFGYWKIN